MYMAQLSQYPAKNKLIVTYPVHNFCVQLCTMARPYLDHLTTFMPNAFMLSFFNLKYCLSTPYVNKLRIY